MNNFLTHKDSQKLFNKILIKAVDSMATNTPIGEFTKVSLEDGRIHRTVIPLTELCKEE